MATSNIRRNFIVEGQDAIDFINTLDDAFEEREKRNKNYRDVVKIVNEKEKDEILKGINKMNKIVSDDEAIATIEFKKGISEEQAIKIDKIISKNYNQDCQYIMKINRNTYKGDMACLSVLAWDNIEDLCNNKLNSLIEKYSLYNKKTNEYEDFIEELL